MKNFVRNLILGAALGSTTVQAAQIINTPRGWIVKHSAAQMPGNWPGFAPSGNWSGNPHPGCAIYGPYFTNGSNAMFTPHMKFKRLRIGSRAHNECTRRNAFRQCTRRDRRSRPGSAMIDIFATVNHEGQRRVTWSHRVTDSTLKSIYQAHNNGSEFSVKLPGQHWPQGATDIEYRLCDFQGVNENNTEIQFTGADLYIQRL